MSIAQVTVPVVMGVNVSRPASWNLNSIAQRTSHRVTACVIQDTGTDNVSGIAIQSMISVLARRHGKAITAEMKITKSTLT